MTNDTTATPKAARPLPVLQGILPLDRARVPVDVIAGLTLAALAIPEVMGYTKIAGMPVITGLYTILLPIALFALLGSSRHLVVGADSATAAIMFAGLAAIATPDTAQWIALAGWCALLTAGFSSCWRACSSSGSSPTSSRERCSSASSPAWACRWRAARSPACSACRRRATAPSRRR